MVTARYKNGTAAVYGSVEDALLQTAHDRSYPGHVNPAYIVEGDHSETHSEWEQTDDGLVHPKHELQVIHGLDDMEGIECNCLLCDFHRQTAGKEVRPQERAELWDNLFGLQYGESIEPYKLAPIRGGSVPGAGFAVTSTAVGLTAATAKSVVGVVAGANTPPDFIEFSGSGDAASGNLLIELVHGTNASAGTSTPFTPVQTRGPTQTLSSTAAVTYSAEPTVLTVTRRWRFPWPGGPFVLQFPLGREPNAVITAATIGKFLGLRATSTVTVTNSDWYVEIEE